MSTLQSAFNSLLVRYERLDQRTTLLTNATAIGHGCPSACGLCNFDPVKPSGIWQFHLLKFQPLPIIRYAWTLKNTARHLERYLPGCTTGVEQWAPIISGWTPGAVLPGNGHKSVTAQGRIGPYCNRHDLDLCFRAVDHLLGKLHAHMQTGCRLHLANDDA
jgi:hypothetical protein